MASTANVANAANSDIPSPSSNTVIEELLVAGPHPIVRSFPQGALLVFDHDLRYLSAGGLGLGEVGSSRSVLEGKTIFEVFPPEVAAVIEPKHRLALDGVESTMDVPYNGHLYLMHLGPLRDAEGQIVAGLGFTQDVTEARRSEEQLRRSEGRARLAFDRAPIGIALIGLDGRYLQVNQAMCDLIGYTADQLCALSGVNIIHPDDLGEAVEVVRQLLSGEVIVSAVDTRYLTSSGQIVWANRSTSLVRGDDGSPLHFISQIQDISERKNYELALAAERSRLHQAELIAGMGSWDLDVETGFIHWSDGLIELRGLNREAFEGNWAAVSTWVHPDDRERVAAAIAHCRESGEPMVVRYRVTRANDGALCWCDARAEAVLENGRTVRIAGTVIDVTADVVAAERAATAHAFQQAVVSASPDLIFVYDLTTRSTIWTNRSIAEALGYPCDGDGDGDGDGVGDGVGDGGGSEPTDDVFARLVCPDDLGEFSATLDEARDAIGDAVMLLDHRMCHADGSTRWFSRHTTALRRDEQGRVVQVVGVLRDRTRRVEIEHEQAELKVRLAEARATEERATLEAQLQQAQRLETVGQLAGGIAHDFNNLLAGITSYASLVKGGLEELGSRGLAEDDVFTTLMQDVQEISAVTERAAALTRQLLIFSRREMVQLTVVDLNSVVADVEKLLGRTIGGHIEVHTQMAADLPRIRADRGQVEQICMNLAVNARHAMPERGQLRIETARVELREADVVGGAQAPGCYAELTVTDNGSGMTSEVAARAFDPFFTTKPKGEGSGLGLATVYGIATRAGGDVTIISELGRGTTVRVLFPATDDIASVPGDDRADHHKRGAGETILLVEDEVMVRKPAQRILARNGYTVLPAEDGAEAMDILRARNEDIDLLLTDVVMPGRSGKELAGDVAVVQPDVPVVFMSGYSEEALVEEGAPGNGAVLIEKPFTADLLLRTVRTAIDEAQL